jgi:hypothetical protein
MNIRVRAGLGPLKASVPLAARTHSRHRLTAAGVRVALLAVITVSAAACNSNPPGPADIKPVASAAASSPAQATPTQSPAPAPTPTTQVPPPPAPVTQPPAAPPPPPAGCYPLSDEGTCYEPGEYCRDRDAGMTGLAGDGETIVCENNDGLRWEPQ